MIAEAGSKTTIKGRIGNRLQSQNLRAYLALALGVLCIGFSAIFTKWAAVDGPVSGFYRVAIATALLALPFAWRSYSQRRQTARSTNTANHVPATASGQGHSPLATRYSLLVLGAALAGLFFSLDLGFWNTSLSLTSAANST